MKLIKIIIKVIPITIDPIKFLRKPIKWVKVAYNHAVLKRKLNQLRWTDADVFDKTINMAGNLKEAIETLAYELVNGDDNLMPIARKVVGNKYKTGWY